MADLLLCADKVALFILESSCYGSVSWDVYGCEGRLYRHVLEYTALTCGSLEQQGCNGIMEEWIKGVCVCMWGGGGVQVGVGVWACV